MTDINEKIWLRTALYDVKNQMRENNLEGFKAVLKVLSRDSLKTLENAEMEWTLDHDTQELREKFDLVRHYLNHLKRFCQRVV